ncbi:two-component system regulatory protein YycI [Shouchella patagoniensis]|uniref:two-component system regulatory protein YycI n=1 Tax=Shouchella patagoniensis TaxID=228576 RepID=UPI0009956C2A|nr:two-component system regulatory protein YycI [Shouchella patagoniensis]
MNWSRTKSIFIVTFFLLNIFLGWQFSDLVRNQLVSIEESTGILGRLDQNNIDLPEGEVNVNNARGVVLEGGRTTFTEEDVAGLPEQEVELSQSGSTITALFEEPIDISELLEDDSSLQPLLSRYMLYGSDYVYARTEENFIYFNQLYGQVEAHVNDDEPLVVEINDEGEAIGYTQRHFAFVENNTEDREILNYMTAIESLLNNHYILRNNSIVDIEFGYYSLADQTPRFFSPMWAVTVDQTLETSEEPVIRIYLVNAVLGDQHQWYPDETNIDEEEDEEEELNEEPALPGNQEL